MNKNVPNFIHPLSNKGNYINFQSVPTASARLPFDKETISTQNSLFHNVIQQLTFYFHPTKWSVSFKLGFL